MPNGNTFICESNKGRLFEVNKEGDIVWEYMIPFHSLNQKVGDDPRELGRNPWTHRAHKFAPDFPAFEGKDLDPSRLEAINNLYGAAAFKEVE